MSDMTALSDITCPLVGRSHRLNASYDMLHSLKFGDVEMVNRTFPTSPPTRRDDGLLVVMKFSKCFM
jgi:hypothetical protein